MKNLLFMLEQDPTSLLKILMVLLLSVLNLWFLLSILSGLQISRLKVTRELEKNLARRGRMKRPRG